MADQWAELEGHEGSFALFTIYEHPLDYPRHYVVRRWFVEAGKEVADIVPRIADTLEEVRVFVPDGRVRTLPRSTDDPTVVEVWL